MLICHIANQKRTRRIRLWRRTKSQWISSWVQTNAWAWEPC